MDAVVIAHAQVLLGHKILILDAVVIAHAQVLELWLDCCYHDDLSSTAGSRLDAFAGQFVFIVSLVKNSPLMMRLPGSPGRWD